MPTVTTVNKNVRQSYRFRMTFTLPSVLLSLMGIQSTLSERLSLLITEADLPANVLDKVEVPTGNGKAYVPGLSYIGDNVSLKMMQVDDQLSTDAAADAVIRFGLNNFFWFWQQFCNWNSLTESEADAVFAALTGNSFYSNATRPDPFAPFMGPGRGNLPSLCKLTGALEVLTPSMGQATELWALQGLFPANVKKGSFNRNNSELLMSDIELSVDNMTPLFIR